MYIKKVIIEGFKSYREETSTEPFSPKVNVVVGANGSGKSNFFHAIRFVLSDMFQNLRSEDRGALLHEGAGHSVVSAFVEIIFDNSDNRIPVDKEEVRLRRTVASKKDEYYLDGKHVSKTEVMNLLESAGFSRSNPYYVVQQGKIASLTLMKDSERLDLLKEIGGTRVYEDRRRESLKIMQETANKRKQIDQVVRYLEERLRELDEEKEELKKYQQLDKQRRSLEYTILDHELNDARNELASMDDNRRQISERMSQADNEVVELREKVKSLEKEIKASTKGINETKSEKEDAEKKRTEALKVVSQIDLDLRDLKDRISSEKRAKDEAVRELNSMRKESEKSKSELAQISKVHAAKLKEEEDISKSIMDREKRLSILYQKQGRATQFKNEAARDEWLRKEIHDLERVLLRTHNPRAQLQESKPRSRSRRASDNIPNPNQAHNPNQASRRHLAFLPSFVPTTTTSSSSPLACSSQSRAISLSASPEMAATPLLSGEDTTPPLHGVVVIALPDRAADAGRDPPPGSEAALGRRAWRLLRLATAPLVVLAAFAAAAHCYGLYSFSSGGEDWKWGGGRASSFLLPLHPKPMAAAAGVSFKAAAAEEGSTAAVLPERQYYTSINIGNPARPYFLDVDTGSALTWIQCDAPCTNCTKGPHPLYKPAKENIVPPRDSHCQELQGNQNYCDTCKQCDYEIAYADRSSSAGVLARDNMELITADGERENMDLVFGCAHDQQGKLLGSPASSDGILGLSNGAMSLPTQLAKQGIISNVFGHCIATDPSGSGYMFLGDDYVPRWGMTWVPVRNGPEDVYSTVVQKVNYGGQELNVREQAGKLTQVIFDSGSSYTYFPHEIYTSLITSLEAVSPGFVRDESDQTLPFCMKPNFPVRSVDDVKQLHKPLLLHFSKTWLVIPRTFEISPENYLIISDKGNVCLGVLDGTEIGHSSTIVIGDVSLRGKLVAYDNDANQIGWAQSDCARPQKASMVPFFLSRALRSQLL